MKWWQQFSVSNKIYTVAGVMVFLIIFDPLRLRQILINIVGNAIKFTDRGVVQVLFKVQDGLLDFRVEDTGIGIPLDQRDILFHPFSQADNSLQKKHGGTGLGLVLSKNLAKLLGGDVNLVESNSQKGSVFLIQVAYQPTATDAAQKETESTPAKAISKVVSPNLLGKKILVVEDTLDSQLLLKLYLTKSGAVVDVANNGKEGMDKALAEFYDLILVDYLSKPVDRARLLNLVHQYVQA